MLLLLAFGLLLLLPRAQAAVRFDVFLGYDGIIPEATWFPVVFEIFNDGPSFNGVVELSPGQFNQGQERQMPIELPTGTTKRFVMPVFASGRASYMSAWDARLVDTKGHIRADALGLRPRKQTNWRLPLMGALSRSVIPLPELPDKNRRSADWTPVVARLQASTFADHPIALEGLRTIYLNSEKALDLKFNQVNALIAWMYAGGHLVIGIDQALQVNGNEWLRQILPVTVTGMAERAQHPELQSWLRSDRLYTGQYSSGTNPYSDLFEDQAFEKASMQTVAGTLRAGSTALIGSPETPLAVIARRGLGQITVLMFSPELEPFLSWKNRAWFWSKILGVPPEVFNVNLPNQYAMTLDAVLGAMIETKQVRKLPIGWLLLLLVAYLAVIGPIDHYWLKKINRQMFTWLTFPIYVAGFSFLIYVIGYKLRAGETEWNELNLVNIIKVGEKAGLRGWTYASIYSPANARYKLASDQAIATLRGEFQRGQEASKARVEQRGGSFAADIQVPVWTSQLYVDDWLRQGEAPLEFSITQVGNDWRLQVINRLDQKITEARIVIAGKLYRLPELAARKTTEVSLSRNLSPQNITNFVANVRNEFYALASQRQQAFSMGGARPTFNLLNGVIASSFLSYMQAPPYQSSQRQYNYGNADYIAMPGVDLSPFLQPDDAVLLAWVPDYAPVKPMNLFSARRTHRNTLLRMVAEVKSTKLEN